MYSPSHVARLVSRFRSVFPYAVPTLLCNNDLTP